jgi:plasmid stability protein
MEPYRNRFGVNDMATITIKNIPDDLYADLKRAAASNRRSINSEIIVSIEQAVRSKRVEPDELLAKIRVLREETAVYLTDDMLDQAINEGRP